MYCLDFIRTRLATHAPERIGTADARQAAVAVILRERGRDAEVLFIKRAEYAGDPWSGHMAFPGGHRDPGDPSLRAAAERETLEEIGLDLEQCEYLGALERIRGIARGRTMDLYIEPHVFAMHGEHDLRANYEVQEIVFSPLAPLVSNRCHDTETRPMAGEPSVFNGYRLPGGHFVWGLTYRMLKSLFAALDPNWQPADES
ncbi:MAG: NUDIX hydrolase [Pseudomonadota bacterium]